MKFSTVVLASCLLLVDFTTSTPTPKSKKTTTLSSTTASLPKTTTKTATISTKVSSTSTMTSTSLSKTTSKTETTSTKVSSTSTKTSSASSKATNYIINFDERTPNPVLAALNPVGIEDTIFFNSWVVDNQPPTVGVPAHSQPNAAVTANEQQLTNGTPTLTVLYPGSPIKSFDFHDFWFGCPANTAASAVDVAVQCTIFLGGFRGGQQVAVSQFTFTPPLDAVDVPMIHAVLPDTFMALDNVTIIQDDPTLQVLATDDYNVTTHT